MDQQRRKKVLRLTLHRPFSIPTMTIPLRLLVLAACLGAGISAAAPRARPFKETVLQPLPGGWMAEAVTLNDIGDAVGVSYGDEEAAAVIWRRGSTQPQAMPVLPGTIDSFVSRINNRGEAVGACVDSDANSHAVMWDGVGVHELPPVPGQSGAQVLGLNDRGQAVGFSDLHATVWDARGVHDLGIPSGAVASEAHAINERGDILLVTYVDDGSLFGITVHYVLRHGKLLPTNLPVARDFWLRGMSSNGTVVGDLIDVETRAYQTWTSQGGKARRLPPLPGGDSSGYSAISTNGKRVGLSGTNGHFSQMVEWDAGGRVKSLEPRLPIDSAATVAAPVAINKRGQVLCSGYDGEKTVGVLLTP